MKNILIFSISLFIFSCDDDNLIGTIECIQGEEVELWGECYNIDETTVLELSNSGLTGEIPSEIGELINLTHLDLYSNQLTGEIPPSIGQLTNLLFLYLDKNQLSGQIPSEIGNLVNLIFLRLSDNNLSDEIPGNICDLTIDWSGMIEIHEIPSPYFDIDNNSLCPPYPECIEDYIGFQYILECGDLPNCDEEIEVYLWGDCYNIEETTSLDLSFQGLNGFIPPEIVNLTNLSILKLNNNQLSGAIPPDIESLTNLSILKLNNNQLSGEIPSNICNLTNLNWVINMDISIFEISSILFNQFCPPYPECIVNYVGNQDCP